MNITDIINESTPPTPWSQGDNIPWNDPAFSERMLREHLSQDHDLASRRAEKIDQQVEWIHNNLLGGKQTNILDLCCGPGLYGSRLAKRGQKYHGIDFSPASIAHANRENKHPDRCTYEEGDVRQTNLGQDYGLVMMLYGEFNVFRPTDAATILKKAHAALTPNGLLLMEPHSHQALAAAADSTPTWNALQTGLFLDRPHLYLQQGYWDEPTQTATRRFYTINATTAQVSRYAASYQAYTNEQYESILTEYGFTDIEIHKALANNEDAAANILLTISACKAS